MKSISIKEARQNFSGLIRIAQDGGSIMITRRGEPVARISPITSHRHKGLPDLTDFRASIRVKGKSLSSTVADLRRQEQY